MTNTLLVIARRSLDQRGNLRRLFFNKIKIIDYQVGFLSILAVTILFILSVTPYSTIADSKKLPIPRFATTKSNEVNARKGPGKNFPIEWIFVKKTEPVEIYREYEQWRQVRDVNDEGGWVHVSVLSGKRSVIIISKDITLLTKTIDPNSKIIAKLSPQLRCIASKCKKDYCRINCNHYQGWVKKTNLWGVYSNEEF